MKAFPTLANERNISRETIQMWKAEVFGIRIKRRFILINRDGKCASMQVHNCRRGGICFISFDMQKKPRLLLVVLFNEIS